MFYLFVWRNEMNDVFQITSVAFGGRNLDVMFVTSARLPMEGKEQPEPAGVVFKVTGIDTIGTPSYDLKL